MNLIAKPLVRIPVRVLCPDGTAPEKADLYLEGAARSWQAWTPKRCHVNAMPGTLTLATRMSPVAISRACF